MEPVDAEVLYINLRTTSQFVFLISNFYFIYINRNEIETCLSFFKFEPRPITNVHVYCVNVTLFGRGYNITVYYDFVARPPNYTSHNLTTGTTIMNDGFG